MFFCVELTPLHLFYQVFGCGSEEPLIIIIRVHYMGGNLKIESAQVTNIKIDRVLGLDLLKLGFGQLPRNYTTLIGVRFDILRFWGFIAVLTVYFLSISDPR